jgi:sugar phosphate isomerase/epimerase
LKIAYTVATPDTNDRSMLALRGGLAGSFQILADAGYNGAELMVRDPGLLDAAEIKRLAADNGLRIPAVSTGQLRKEDGLSFTSPDATVRSLAVDRTRRVINFAAEFGAQVNLGSLRGQLPPGDERNPALEASAACLRTLIEYAANAGVGLAVEPQCRFVINWLNSVAETLRFFETLGGSHPTLLFDVYHAMLEEQSVAAALVQAYPHISWVQVSDSNRMAPGSGQLAIADAVRVLRALGYDGFLSVECIQRPDGETAARRSARFLAPLLDEPC